MNSRALHIFLAMMVCGLAGCANPEARIKKNPDLFSRLTPAQQALVKAGKVAVGFDEDTVRLAVGGPDRKWIRTDSAGVSEVWSYTLWKSVGGLPLYRGWYHGYYDPVPTYYLNYPDRKEHEYLKVVLKAGTVTAVEEEAR